MKRIRLDEELVRRGLAEDVRAARGLVMAGTVLVDEVPVDKAGTRIADEAAIRLKTTREPFASRAGRKLAGALQTFRIEVEGKIALDLGASTGGFTDCLLQQGAKRVYAVDVGTNQLAWHLRRDARVISLEKTHARVLDRTLVPDAIDILVADVSFTSLRYVLPFAFPLLAENAPAICLFKPQFEVAAERVLPGGLVTPEDTHAALEAMTAWCAARAIRITERMPSPITGRRGNQEYLLRLDGMNRGLTFSDS